MSNYANSIYRAAKLIKTPINNKDFILIKIIPDPSGCCCLNHWKSTWQSIDEYIYPVGQILTDTTRNEGDVLIHLHDSQYVLECHETGPEIVIYLGAIVMMAQLIKSIAALMAVTINSPSTQNVLKYKLKTFGNDGIII